MKFLQLFKVWKRPVPSPVEDFSKVDAVIAIPFGSHNESQPVGRSNASIAALLISLHIRFNLPIGTQWEIAECNQAIPCEVIVGPRFAPHITTPEFFAAIKMARPEWKTIILVAHPDHIQRCVWTAEKMSYKVLIPDVSTIPYDPASSQWWCRGRAVFLFWELAARLVCWWKGWI